MKETTCAAIEALQKGEIDSDGHLSSSDYYSPSINKYWKKKSQDFTNQVNKKYVPQGYTLSSGQLTGVILGSFGVIVYTIYSVLFRTVVSAGELKDGLMKNEDGVSA